MVNFKQKKMLPLTNERLELHKSQKVCYICKGKLECAKTNLQKVKDHRSFAAKHRGAILKHSIL